MNVTSIDVSNVTSVGVPQGDVEGPAYVVNTVYDLQWPNSSATLDQVSSDVCASFLISPVWPNVTNDLKSNDGSCTSAIGRECELAIRGTIMGANGRCAPNGIWSELEQCQGVFPPNNGRFTESKQSAIPALTRQEG